MSYQALRRSIEHWRENANIESLDQANISANACACCRQYVSTFNSHITSDCDGCPIALFTGRKHCSASPYSAASAAFDEVGGDFDDAFLRAAHEEVVFLEHIMTQYFGNDWEKD